MDLKNFYVLTLVFLSLFLLKSVSAQQNFPSAIRAGQVEKTIDQEKTDYELEKEVSLDEINIESDNSIEGSDVKIWVSGYTFVGNSVVSINELNVITADYTEKEVSIGQIKRLCQIISNLYRKKGYFLAQAFLPVQEIQDGLVTIEIVEGSLGQVVIEGNERYSQRYLSKRFKDIQGKAVRYQDLVGKLLLLNELPQIDSRATFTKGSEPGTTDLLLEVQEDRRFQFSMDFDNEGSELVSEYRLGAELNFQKLLFSGDQINFRPVIGESTDDLYYVDVSYDWVFNRWGTKLSLSHNQSEFEVGADLAILGISGDQQSTSFNLSQPMVRTRQLNLDFDLGIDTKEVENFLLGSTSSLDELTHLKLSLSGDYVDSFSGRTYFDLSFKQGLSDFLGSYDDVSPTSSRVGSGSDHNIISLNLTRLQKINSSAYLVARYISQFSSDILPAVEQFSIGGASTVRGFDPSRYLGDEGFLLSLELRTSIVWGAENQVPWMDVTWREFLQLQAFIDHGQADLNQPLSFENNTEEITGAGVGFSLFFPGELTVKVEWAAPLSGDTEQDDSSKWYFQIKKNFL